MRFPPEFIDRVREASDVVAVVGEHVRLKRAGRTWKALCPFHTEKTPSFTVNQDRQIFKCFGCGEGGDVFRFVMEFEKLSFPEAIETLAGRSGIPLPKQTWTGAAEESVFPALEWAAMNYRQELSGRTGGAAREYLTGRGIEAPVIERYGLGWAPKGWSHLLDAAQSRYSVQLLERAGLAIANDRGGHYDRFRGRLMIPIRSALGRTIGFGARTLGDEEPKYLNSPETEVFHKGKVLYGLAEARDALKAGDHALIVEGYMDAFALAQNGLENVVASCGTAFTEEQARVVKRYVDRVVLLFDGDTAGLRAAWKSAAVFLAEGLDVAVVALPQGHDPDSYIRDEGAQALQTRIAEAPGVVGFAREALLDRMEKREDLVRALAFLGSRIDDAIRRRALLQEAAEAFRFDEATLAAECDRLRRGNRQAHKPAGRPEPVAAADPVGRAYLARIISAASVNEEQLVPEAALREPCLRELYARWHVLRAAGETRPATRLVDDDATRALTAEIMAQDDTGAELEDLVPRMLERARDVRSREIQEAIREAESRGDHERVRGLLREKQSLKTTG